MFDRPERSGYFWDPRAKRKRAFLYPIRRIRCIQHNVCICERSENFTDQDAEGPNPLLPLNFTSELSIRFAYVGV